MGECRSQESGVKDEYGFGHDAFSMLTGTHKQHSQGTVGSFKFELRRKVSRLEM